MLHPGLENGGKATKRWLPLLAGFTLAITGPALWFILRPSAQSLLFWLCWAGLLVGGTWALIAAFLPPGRLLAAQRWITGNLLVFAIMLAAAEGGFRLAGTNFNNLTGQTDDPRAHYPLCLRLPDRPLGAVFFTRDGPLTWTGRPLATFLQINKGTDPAYAGEKEFTARYDADGFRNPEGQTDWQAVVVGDSFAESGALPFEEIFTTQAAARSGMKIRNLGVCNTGTLSHLEYLRQFGKSASTQQAVLAFYDGNDILDTELEMADLKRHQATGWRPSRTPQPQTSLLKAGYQVAKHLLSPPQAFRYQNAWLTSARPEMPITVRSSPMPLDPETASPEQKELLENVIRQWGATCREMGLQPSLLYIPANNRTYHGLVRFDGNADPAARDWVPGSLPAWMRQFCQAQGIRFLDACPVLRQSAEKGVLVYNPILDTHLNAEGSRLIGELLAKHLSDANSGAFEMPPP